MNNFHRLLQIFDHFSSAYSKQLREYRDQFGCMLKEIDKALEFLQEMKERHLQVSHKTSALHQACEQLVEEQVSYCESFQQVLSIVFFCRLNL